MAPVVDGRILDDVYVLTLPVSITYAQSGYHSIAAEQ